jgi:prevent-host-death family protein
VSLDSYYRDIEEIPLEECKKVNFDHPDALDWELLHQHLAAISEGRTFEEPGLLIRRLRACPRDTPHRTIGVPDCGEPVRLYWPELRATLNTKVYVQTDPAVCFERRLRRDVAERGVVRTSYREVCGPRGVGRRRSIRLSSVTMAMEISYTSLRDNLARVLDQVVDQQETVVVRRKGARDVALIPAAELAGLVETGYLLRSPRNARRLLAAMHRASRER